MTFDEYIKNPQGKSSAVMTNKAMYHEMYTKKWDELMVRENGNVTYKLYNNKNKDYYIHIKIPDEVIPKFYYDVVIRFFLEASRKDVEMENSLKNYSVQFYSNDPGFMFTFAYVFKHNKLFVPDLESKMSKIALTEKPKIRNPKCEVGYVKSFYFAYLVIKSLGLFAKSKWELASPYNKSVWNSAVQHADDKVRDRQLIVNAASKKNKREENAAKNRSTGKSSNMINQKITGPKEPNFGPTKKTVEFKGTTKTKTPNFSVKQPNFNRNQGK